MAGEVTQAAGYRKAGAISLAACSLARVLSFSFPILPRNMSAGWFYCNQDRVSIPIMSAIFTITALSVARDMSLNELHMSLKINWLQIIILSVVAFGTLPA